MELTDVVTIIIFNVFFFIKMINASLKNSQHQLIYVITVSLLQFQI
jgi:hypothetical protein